MAALNMVLTKVKILMAVQFLNYLNYSMKGTVGQLKTTSVLTPFEKQQHLTLLNVALVESKIHVINYLIILWWHF